MCSCFFFECCLVSCTTGSMVSLDANADDQDFVNLFALGGLPYDTIDHCAG